MNNRELIYSTLFNTAAKAANFVTTSRKWVPYSAVATADQPALFMSQVGEVAEIRTRVPTKWTLKADLVIYCQAGADTDSVPASVLNPLLDAVVAALAPPPGQDENTLGGLVERCRVEGDLVIHEGVLGDQAVAIIPVTILTV